jgi:hypothetical protein
MSSYTGGMMTTITTGTGSKEGDVVLVEATTGALTINVNSTGFDAASAVGIGNVNGNLDNILAPVTVNRLSGLVALQLADQFTLGGQDYTVTGTTISRQSGQHLIVTYHDMYTVELHASSGVNTVDVQSTSAAATFIYAGLSNDTITVDALPPAGTYTAIQIANPGSHVIINDGNTASLTYTFRRGLYSSANEILSTSSGIDSGTIDLAGPLQDLVFNGGSPSIGHDTYKIETLDYNTTISAGAGSSNIFQVSPVEQKLENILGALTIHGAGNDTLDFYDFNNPNNEMYTCDSVPSSLALASDSNFSVNWTGMESVHLFTNGHSFVHDLSMTVLVDQ